MKKTLLISISFFMIIISTFGQANQYKNLWQKVEDFEKKSLPKSAAHQVDNILKRAIEDKNSPQMIKALIHQGKYEIAIDAENDMGVFDNLNAMLASAQSDVEKAVIHSMLSSLYKQYYESNLHHIGQRTDLYDHVPRDMKEWTKSIYINKIVEHALASLAPQAVLEDALVEEFEPIVVLGNDARQFYPSMFDFLALRALETLRDYGQDLSMVLDKAHIDRAKLFAPNEQFAALEIDAEAFPQLAILSVYQKMIRSLEARRLHQSTVLVALSRLDYVAQLHSAHKEHGLALLQELYEKWKDDGMSIEIVDAMCNFYEYADADIPRLQPTTLEAKGNENIAKMYALLNKTIAKFPKHKRVGILKNRLNNIVQAQFTIDSRRAFAPDEVKSFDIQYRNVELLRAKLYKLDDPIIFYSGGYKSKEKIRKQFVKEIDIPLKWEEPYLFYNDSFVVDVTTPGAYRLELDMDKEMSNSRATHYYFTVTNLASFARATATNQVEVFVVDRTSGTPQEGAKVNFYERTNRYSHSEPVLVATVPVDKRGLALFEKESKSGALFYQAVANGDEGMAMTQVGGPIYTPSSATDSSKEVKTRRVFTDRSLYRPGQTVYFKAIAATTKNNISEVQENQTLELSLFDTNNREVATRILTTNEFGSVSGEFVLPSTLLPGNYSIRTKGGQVYFKVEEYKRPTFEITFDKIEKSYKLNDTVTLKGKIESFSGVPVQEAEVAYNITRQRSMWWRWMENAESYESGAIATDSSGKFSITFVPKAVDEIDDRLLYIFNVETTVTDINGETQHATYPIRVSRVSMHLTIDMPTQMEKDSHKKITIEATNPDGNKIEAEGNYRIYSLHKNDSIHRLLHEDSFKTGEQKSLKEHLSTLPSGKYRIKVTSRDSNNNSVEAKKDIVLFSYSDKKPPIETNDWLVVKNNTIGKAEPAEVILGVSSKNIKVLYEEWVQGKLHTRRWMDMSNENKRFLFASEEYEKGVVVLFTYIKEGKFYHHNISLMPKEEKKELTISLDLFRDRIEPGSEEEWRLTVVGGDGAPVASEVLATMYDYSLNSLNPVPAWRLNVPRASLLQLVPALYRDASIGELSISGFENMRYSSVPSFEFDRFNWYGFTFYNRLMSLYGVRSNAQMREESAVLGMKQALASSMDADSATMHDGEDAGTIETEESVEEASPLRENFNETAFFYPQLRTNSDGKTVVVFKVPDSNTRWHFRALAHNRDMDWATTEAFAISQKKLMVTTNLPRFLREGDITSISAKISNITSEALDASVQMVLFNPITEEEIADVELSNSVQQLSIDKESSASVSWSFTVPTDLDVVGVRVVAQSELFSDGEQHALVVLPNRMLVTESMRMDVDKNQTRHFTMDRLVNKHSSTIEDYRLTLEFASNPAWFAIQALPLISAPDNDNAVAWFASYYSNVLGQHIANQYPKVKRMVDLWEKQGGKSQALVSNLAKNEALKSVLLEETPWVLEAQSEAEQKQRLSMLFNLNRSAMQSQASIDKLKELQDASGGWAWVKGLRPNRSITQYILYGMSQLRQLQATTFSDDVRAMQAKAISFIDSEALKQFEQWKENNKNWERAKSISIHQLEYLYVRSLYRQYPQSDELKAMSDFYFSIIRDNWTGFSKLYPRALIAYLMQKEGNGKVAEDIIKSFREHATVSEELGMYWANNREYVFMSQSSVSVHHFIMEAFRAVGAKDREIDNMKKWLLKQKQTQLWESTHATVDAVYALLSTGSDWFETDGETTITINEEEIDVEDKDLGTGYFTKTWNGEEISTTMGDVKVEQKGNAPAWGALYWQYYEDIDKIEGKNDELDVKKELYREEVGERGKQLVRISDENELRVGDKMVVRLTVRANRNFEFVHLKDMRAAAFEPINQLSGVQWHDGVLYYQTSKDASTHFYFDALPRGTYVFEYSVFVNRSGQYSNGVSTIQCMYAPEFTSHTKGIRINVKE